MSTEAHDEPVKAESGDAGDADSSPLTNPAAILEQAVEMVEAVLDDEDDATNNDSVTYWAAARQPGDIVVEVDQSRYPMPDQSDKWVIPPRMREYALAILWRVMRSKSAKALVKIRAVEALIRLDCQALNSERHVDWREVQAGKATRSNVRTLADLVERSRSNGKSS